MTLAMEQFYLGLCSCHRGFDVLIAHLMIIITIIIKLPQTFASNIPAVDSLISPLQSIA